MTTQTLVAYPGLQGPVAAKGRLAYFRRRFDPDENFMRVDLIVEVTEGPGKGQRITASLGRKEEE